MNLVPVMDEIAEKLRAAPSLAGRTYAYPQAKVVPPAAIVTYPTDGTFDATYGRGVDTMTGGIVIVVGRPNERTARDRLAKYINGTGAESVKALVDGDEDDYTSCDGVRVAEWETDVYTLGAIDYLAVIFRLEIAGPGTA